MKLKRTYRTLKLAFNSIPNLFHLLLIILSINIVVFSQSTDQNSPTPISTNQINGQIKARDIGDSRLTTYYYVFNGNRGDIFVNIITSNLNGDIDIFTLEGLNPRTKITIYADDSENETGRVIYMRKPEKLLLRINGRTPNDDPATFQIKFAGSFEPMQAIASNDQNIMPEVTSANTGKVKVNSVGTIIEEPKTEVKVAPVEKQTLKETESVAVNEELEEEKLNDKVDETVNSENNLVKDDQKIADQPKISPIFDPTKKVEDIIKENKVSNKPQVLITDNIPTPDNSDPEIKEVTVDIKKNTEETSAVVTIEREVESDIKETNDSVNEVDPLAKINLKVELKDGTKFERPMSEVLSMNIIKGILTIVTNDGKIQEFSILDVLKTTIE